MAQLLAARTATAAAKRRLGADGAFTTARRFEGGGFASINDTAALRTPTTAITVAGWCKLLGLGDSGASLMMKQYANVSPWLSYAIQAQGAGVGEFKFRIGDGASFYGTTNLAALPTGVWLYLVGRWESGGTMTLDHYNAAGTLVETVSSGTVTTTIAYANYPLVFAQEPVTSNLNVPYDGSGWLIHDARLSDGQVTTHREGTFPVSAAAGMWRFGVSDPETDASGNGLSLQLSDEQLQVVAGPDDTTAPVVSGVGTSGVGDTFATVSWSTDENADSEVEYGPTVGYGTSVTSAALTTAHSLQITGLTAGTEYHYRVVSVDTNGNTTTSADGTFTTAAASVPSAPTGVNATGGDEQVSIGWVAVAGADTYTVYRSTTSGSGFASVQTGIVGTSWVDTGLTNDTTYYYLVTATNGSGESADSAEVSATPAAVGTITHGSQVTPANVGLRGAGYTYDSGTDTFSHPTHGALTPTGSLTATSNGQVIEGMDVSGNIDINGFDNVTIRRCRVKSTGNVRGIDAGSGETGLLVEDSDVTHVGSVADAAVSSGIYSTAGQWIVRRNSIHRWRIGIQSYGTNILAEENVIWDPHKVSGTHGNASSFRGTDGGTYRRNYLCGNSSACLAFYADFQPQHNMTVEDCYFTAVDLVEWGGSQLGTPSYLLNAGGRAPAVDNTNFFFTGNIFFRTQAGEGGDWPNGGQYGAVQNGGDMATWPGSVSSNNNWADGPTAFSDFGPV